MCKYQLVVDETNLTTSEDAKFFITGGIFFPEEKLQELHFEMENIRRRYGFQSRDLLKFNTHSQNRVSPDVHKAAKNEVLSLCLRLPVYFVASVRLHAIAKKKVSRRELVTWGADSILLNFHNFLRERNAYGVVSFDTLPFKNGTSYLQEKFGSGLVFQDDRKIRLSDRILDFDITCDGSSHKISVADVVLGAYRYCVNKREDQNVAASTMMPYIWQMALWGTNRGNAFDLGLRFLPQKVKIQEYELQYIGLKKHLGRLAGYEDIA